MESSAAFSESRPAGPNVFGLVWSWPLSSVISASTPAPSPRSTSRTIARVTTSAGKSAAVGRRPGPFGMLMIILDPLPQDGAAHAHADAHGRQAVPDIGSLGELRGELDHQPDAGGRERVTEGDRAAPRVHPRVIVGDLEVAEEDEHLHGERLVDLDEADVVHGEVVTGEELLGRGDGADAHHLGLAAGKGEVNKAHLRGEAQLRGDVFRRQDAPGRAVVDAARVAGGDPAMGTERRLERAQPVERRLRPRRTSRSRAASSTWAATRWG